MLRTRPSDGHTPREKPISSYISIVCFVMLIINVAKTQAQVNFSVSKGFFKAELSSFVFGVKILLILLNVKPYLFMRRPRMRDRLVGLFMSP